MTSQESTSRHHSSRSLVFTRSAPILLARHAPQLLSRRVSLEAHLVPVGGSGHFPPALRALLRPSRRGLSARRPEVAEMLIGARPPTFVQRREHPLGFPDASRMPGGRGRSPRRSGRRRARRGHGPAPWPCSLP